MKSVFKSVAPMALAITVALSGVAMAETVAPTAKSADSAAAQPTKPAAHQHQTKEVKKEAAAPVTLASTASATTPAASSAAEKSAPAAEVKKAVEPIKGEPSKIEPSKTEPAKTESTKTTK